MRSVVFLLPGDVSEGEARLLLAVALFEEGRVSVGMAAEVAGHLKPTFMKILASNGVASVNQSAEELGQDLENA